MEQEMLEKAKLRIYLRMQIRKIRKMLELRRLQILCKLRKIVKTLIPTEYPIIFYETEGIDTQINVYLYVISARI